jgi:hypothetical protein
MKKALPILFLFAVAAFGQTVPRRVFWTHPVGPSFDAGLGFAVVTNGNLTTPVSQWQAMGFYSLTNLVAGGTNYDATGTNYLFSVPITVALFDAEYFAVLGSNEMTIPTNAGTWSTSNIYYKPAEPSRAVLHIAP